MSNPFSLFNLPVQFSVDRELLSERYLTLQKQLHPDNFASHSVQEQRLAIQKSAEINDAFQVLKSPVRRAESIILINTGETQNVEEKSMRDMDFLMQQLEWREKLEHIEHTQNETELTVFLKQINTQEAVIIAELDATLSAKNWQKATALCDKLRYIQKLITEIERVEEAFFE
ncbi:co-chaperone protein HscB [Nicoletella semolina]|uniref:Co-chaperone protein HscB homolog n=1 Tax=Nicoletella semolina TaxID=271160 RepID=A0A4R2NA10_9PAST|nr:Fe-S protein assembly co-chaperone HscB [Nicoletella semolina]MDH2925351.1 co-chaperone HscB [Nicoletella semolina]TCP17828.1 co-chaperone protein HscB [Nicoletella semolina]